MEKIRQFSSLDEYYDKAFSTFIKSTDQKQKAKAWLTHYLNGLDSKQTVIDAGAGNGVLTTILAKHFETVLAVEPNENLLPELATAGEHVQILDQSIMEAVLNESSADLVLCSHVLYYIPQVEWDTILERLLHWTRPGGRIIIILQAEDTDCMKFFQKMRNKEFPIMAFMENFAHSDTAHTVEVVRQSSTIRSQSREDLELILEFLLNLTPFDNEEAIPAKKDLHDFIESLSQSEAGEFSMSCDQLFCIITK
jgi:2-polyprenyl-3-methyl-5-hydroxy-6-metoxy-1,4-benzoquinol methylase